MIPRTQVVFASASLLDDTGRVFFWNNEIYRAINSKYVDFYRDLLEEGILDDLFERGLVKTMIAPQSLEGYELTLHHQRVPFVSNCVEWSIDMLRDAALFYCDLVANLNAKGLGLKDAHPWNVLFDRGHPVFVDFGSVISEPIYPANVYHEFQSWFIMPLLLMSVGMLGIARTLLSGTIPPSSGDILRLLLRRVPAMVWIRYSIKIKKLQKLALKDGAKAFVLAKEFIKSIPLLSQSTEWTNYLGPGAIYSLDEPSQWNIKSRNVQAILERLKPNTVIDIGSNRGWFSEMAERSGADVVAIDIDEPNTNALYKRIKTSRAPILPIFMDICLPTPLQGYSFPAATVRLKADMALVLAVTHHLVFKRGLSFEFIAERLSDFSGKWLLVEFVPPNDQYVREWMSDKFDWYCQDAFIKALEKYFIHVDVFESYPEPRVLLFFEK